jgi:hypothetical protein
MAKGKPLPFRATKWTGNLNADSLDIIRVAHPDVSEVIRILVDTYADRLREKLKGTTPP